MLGFAFGNASRQRVWALTSATAVSILVILIVGARKLQCQKQRRKQRKEISIRVSSRFLDGVLREAMQSRGIVDCPTACCSWGDFATLNWDRFLEAQEPFMRVSCLYVRAGLVRKGMLAHYMAKRRIDDVLPEGFVMDLEDEDDIKALVRRLSGASSNVQCKEHPLWIAKASDANRGENLFLARSPHELADALKLPALEQGVTEWVVQRYIAPPLLIDGRKFHVRAHVLVSGCPNCGTTHAWLHKDHHVVLVATSKYTDSCSDRFAHLTNHCAQVMHPDYDEREQILPFRSLDQVLGKSGLSEHVLKRMEYALAEAFASATRAPLGFSPLPHCFELFGADFTLQDCGEMDPTVWLLEINAGPDLGVFGEQLRSSCVALLEEVLRVAVEPHMASHSDQRFQPCDQCYCTTCATSTSFGKPIWSNPPRTASARDELQTFKRRLGNAGRWAQSLHEGSGIVVRGVQSKHASSEQGNR